MDILIAAYILAKMQGPNYEIQMTGPEFHLPRKGRVMKIKPSTIRI